MPKRCPHCGSVVNDSFPVSDRTWIAPLAAFAWIFGSVAESIHKAKWTPLALRVMTEDVRLPVLLGALIGVLVWFRWLRRKL